MIFKSKEKRVIRQPQRQQSLLCVLVSVSGSSCLPFPSVLRDGKQFKSPEELSQVFRDAGVDVGGPVVATCGSGLTASILALAIHQVNGKVVSQVWASSKSHVLQSADGSA